MATLSLSAGLLLSAAMAVLMLAHGAHALQEGLMAPAPEVAGAPAPSEAAPAPLPDVVIDGGAVLYESAERKACDVAEAQCLNPCPKGDCKLCAAQYNQCVYCASGLDGCKNQVANSDYYGAYATPADKQKALDRCQCIYKNCTESTDKFDSTLDSSKFAVGC